MKARHNCSDAFLTELLQFMKPILPARNTLPATANKAKFMIEPFRLKCEIIHACPNDCVLYQKDYADMDECPNCKASRWKPVDKKKPHAKTWESSTYMRHHVDSPCRKFIDSKWPEFSAEKRNPLVDELKELWSVGKLTYDAHTKSNFTLKAILMWCVHDFPAYGHVSGCRTSGRFGCSVCGEKTDAIWVKNERKFIYKGHRRFLPADHPFRNAKEKFDGTEEHGDAPCRLTGAQLLAKMNSVRTEFGKFTSRKEKTSNSTGKRCLTGVQLLNTMNRVRTESCRETCKRKQTVDTRIPPNMKKRSFDTSTPWSKRSILFDLPYWEERGPGKSLEMPPAPYRLSIEERKLVCTSLSNLKVPIGYCGNWKGKVSLLFKVLCSKVLDIAELRIMHQRLVESICVFEMYFPPHFFVSIIHVVVHLAEEAETLGPVTTRWMYPIERMMRTFKVFGRNENYIEGSITEKYVLDDALRHCMEYIMNGREKCYKKKGRISTDDDIQEGPYAPNMSKGKRYHIPNSQYEQARRWVLMHSEENTEWEKKYDILHVRGRRKSRNLDEYMKCLRQQFQGKDVTYFKRLVDGPSRYAESHNAYAANGYIFYTADAEKGMSTQTSGVSMNATTTFRESARDQNTMDDEVLYFRIVKQILELDYTTFKQTLFYCDWVPVEDKVNGWYVDSVTKQIYINFERFMGNKKDTDEPFIHSSQATSVFYCKDESRPDRKWHIVLESPKRRSPYVNTFEDPFVFTGIAKESSLTAVNLDDNSNSEEDAFKN
ncbi:uncharacterized protein LOC113305076 [Papaver somniferum]|uniref:uncharacterized protein LOC113305076 n=1 Tax=Papaver somniferum TaxID=3469 RepID=UPI000E6FAAD9|nr:uncharacterized protein LOC113305076 [Papaver somniferum]